MREKHGSVKLVGPRPRESTFFSRLRDKIAIRTRLRQVVKSLRLSTEAESKREVSYSQFGEDVIVSELLQDLSFKNICYLDIGANKPKFMNNTYLFYERGFRGVLVEPNSSLCEELRAERPGDVVLNVGVGIDEHISEADFYMFSEDIDGLNTFSHEGAKHWENVGMDGEKYMIDRIVKVPLMNVNDIISNYFTDCPDYVSIDVEGLDLQVLETFDFAKYQPAIFCVETLAYNTDGSTYKIQPIFGLLEDKGYFPYRETYANTIFVNKNSYYDYHYQFARGNRVSDKKTTNSLCSKIHVNHV